MSIVDDIKYEPEWISTGHGLHKDIESLQHLITHAEKGIDRCFERIEKLEICLKSFVDKR